MANLREDASAPVSKDDIALFVLYCVKHMLNSRNIAWHIPNEENLRRNSTTELYMGTNMLGKALGEVDMRNRSRRLAKEVLNFDVDAWLQMPLDLALEYQHDVFLHFTFALPNAFYKHLMPLALACDLCCEALVHGKSSFVLPVLDELIQVMQDSYNYMGHYWDLKRKAMKWYHLRKNLRRRDPDDGYLSLLSDDSMMDDSD